MDLELAQEVYEKNFTSQRKLLNRNILLFKLETTISHIINEIIDKMKSTKAYREEKILVKILREFINKIANIFEYENKIVKIFEYFSKYHFHYY